MVITALVLIVEYQHSFWITIPAIIMISREIIISALREWMAELGERNKVAVSWLGKVKTTSQMLALGGLLWRYNVLYGNIGNHTTLLGSDFNSVVNAPILESSER